MKNLNLTFSVEELNQIFAILGEIPVKYGAAAVFGIMKDRAEKAANEANEANEVDTPTAE